MVKSIPLAILILLVGCGGDDAPVILNPRAAEMCRAMERAFETSMARCLYSEAAQASFRASWERSYGDDCGNVVEIRSEPELNVCISWVVDTKCHDVELALETDTLPSECRGQLIIPNTGKL